MNTKGSCMCGNVEYQFSGEPEVRAVCHCLDCQKWSGSAFTSNAVVPRTSFKVNKGHPKSYDAVADSGKINKHFFCDNCGSGLYTELEIMPQMTCVKAGGLDGGMNKLDDKIGVEFYVKDRMPYLNPVHDAKQEKFMGM